MSLGKVMRVRFQSTFWIDFIRHFDQYGEDSYRIERIKLFEKVFMRLIDQVLLNLTVSEDLFVEFDFFNEDDE